MSSFAGSPFSEQALADLLEALRARAASHPENPGLIACWPGVHQSRMAGACGELRRRGYPVEQVSITLLGSDRVREGWALTGPGPRSS